mmetsp:Transcript_33228/g.59493  ORF Transcript_33228/g.59493 Transcript_33228/m.59493 type:complete len:210 (-) Transcript_33228:281-910(-)
MLLQRRPLVLPLLARKLPVLTPLTTNSRPDSPPELSDMKQVVLWKHKIEKLEAGVQKGGDADIFQVGILNINEEPLDDCLTQRIACRRDTSLQLTRLHIDNRGVAALILVSDRLGRVQDSYQVPKEWQHKRYGHGLLPLQLRDNLRDRPEHTRHLSDDFPSSLVDRVVPVLGAVRIARAVVRENVVILSNRICVVHEPYCLRELSEPPG